MTNHEKLMHQIFRMRLALCKDDGATSQSRTERFGVFCHSNFQTRMPQWVWDETRLNQMFGPEDMVGTVVFTEEQMAAVLARLRDMN